jgi:hypothetical protein
MCSGIFDDVWCGKDQLMAQGHDLDAVELTNPQIRYRERRLLFQRRLAVFFMKHG